MTSRDDFTKFLPRFGLPADPYQSGFQDIGTERFTWETRLAGGFGDSINWILGVFYMDEKRLYKQANLKYVYNFSNFNYCFEQFL